LRQREIDSDLSVVHPLILTLPFAGPSYR
jgi:hypothetical protein